MSTQTDTDCLAALAGIRIVCDAGHARGSSIPPCDQPAVWTTCSHGPSVEDTCPRVLLLCDAHLESLRQGCAQHWAALSLIPLPKICGLCKVFVLSTDDMLWGIERITP